MVTQYDPIDTVEKGSELIKINGCVDSVAQMCN